MHEDAAGFALFGLNVYAYGIFVSAGLLAMIALFAISGKKRGLPAGAGALFGALALPLMLLFSRLLFCLLDMKFRSVFSLRAVLTFWGGGLSMTGAAAGAVLAALLCARILRVKKIAALDILAPALLLFMACARFGEHFLETLGRSRTLTSAVAGIGVITQSDGYDAYLRTYLFESAAALVIGVILWIKKEKRAGDTLLTGMLLFGCAQTVLESLRFDAHMRFSFVSMQQIVYAVLFAAALLFYSASYAKRIGRKSPLIVSVALIASVVGGVIALEFAIDRSGLDRIALYAGYILLAFSPAALGLWYKKEGERA